MNNNLSESSPPDLYKYLTRCAIEQIGPSSEDEKKKLTRAGTPQDVRLVQEYALLVKDYFLHPLDKCRQDQIEEYNLTSTHNIRMALTDPFQLRFLEEFKNCLQENLTVSVSRDNQVLEILNKNIPARHSVTLTFSIQKKNYSNSIIFQAIFRQKCDSLPVGNGKINISHMVDYSTPLEASSINYTVIRLSPDDPLHPIYKKVSSRMIKLKTTANSQKYFTRKVSTEDTLIKNLSCPYLLQDTLNKRGWIGCIIF